MCQNCAENRIQFNTLAFEAVGQFSELVQKILNWISALVENRNFQTTGFSLAFGRLGQLISVTATKMLAARDVSL